MSRKTVPTIEPVNVKQYDVKQSKYHQCGTLPIRSVLLGPSGAGTVSYTHLTLPTKA